MTSDTIKHICVIDDDKDFINIVNSYTPENYIITNFSWKSHYLLKHFFHEIIDSYYDLYIIDINLPGISGHTLGAYIRDSLGPETLIIYTSSSSFSIDESLRNSISNNIYLQKPLNQLAFQSSLEYS